MFPSVFLDAAPREQSTFQRNGAALHRMRSSGHHGVRKLCAMKDRAHRLVQRQRVGVDGIDIVEFDLRWPVPKDRLAGLLAAMEVGTQILADVPASCLGTSTNKFFDYIASGIPVLNNYPGWVAQMITENDCGVAVPPGDPEAFALALQRLAGNRAVLNSMGARARQLAQREFDRVRLGDRFVDVLEAVGVRA